jgi:hypothetical protein
MTADTVYRANAHGGMRKKRAKGRSGLLLPVAALAVLFAAAGGFIAYVLWPTWPGTLVALDAPAIPITVAGVLFDVPPAAIRFGVQRHSGPHERVDLVLVWPSLTPPSAADSPAAKPAVEALGERPPAAAAPPSASRLFVTIAALGNVLPPQERLRTIYPRYTEPQAATGADGLAVLRFRAGSPYEGEDLIYFAETPERFFARCTRDAGAVRGICMQDRALDKADITLRFPRKWLDDWRGLADGFDRLIARLHPQGN